MAVGIDGPVSCTSLSVVLIEVIEYPDEVNGKYTSPPPAASHASMAAWIFILPYPS